ncbi:hypothetical protein Ctob_015624 [Chrysochromulina tobinii]|uniref:Uncharacterized protein n=1 Tax=Chrysochromulina tobinii TaxID=1460289 RepID=A0A0M0K4I0_9EUKA|nr:hypothetical protein Ctob_015624 [Chrysochromulina tobinii]|eukprot:KOO33487.1 hypothetical protein Ctob_015624 [Chrysochromulina sp. CCMP291]
MAPSEHCAGASPWSAASLNSAAARLSSWATPRPSRCMSPSKHCAAA